MSQVSKKKLKQVTLPFVTPSPDKKRKREDDSIEEEETKSRKTCEPINPKSNSIQILKDSNTNQASIGDGMPREDHESLLKQLPKVEATENEKMDVDISVEQPRVPDVTDIYDTTKIEVPASIENVCAVGTSSLETSQQSRNDQMSKNEPKSVSDINEEFGNTDPSQQSENSQKSINENESESNANKKSVDSQIKKLSAKQLQRKQEAEAKRLEREKLKQEKEKKRLEEKEAKEKKRLAEIEARNEEKRQKEERKLKEEEKRKQKEAERKAKEEERKSKEEEKQKKIEEIRLKEEQEKKNKEKIAANFKNFFVPKNKTNASKALTDNSNDVVNSLFMPFEVKEDMKLAVTIRATLTTERKQYLDTVLQDVSVDNSSLYLAQLKSKNYKPGHSENTLPLNLNDDEDQKDGNSLGNEIRTRYRCKLLQFSENRRPAYWGTWRKRSKSISGKTPFKCDTKFFEYDVDSDEEWVEEEGESLHGSDDEKESDHEYEVDNDLFVPHGYLSDEEAPRDDEAIDQSPKSQTRKLDLLKTEFEAELKEKTCKLKSRSYGCSWIANNVHKGANEIEDLLLLFRGVCDFKLTPFTWKQNTGNASCGSSISNTAFVKAKLHSEFPKQFLPDFIRLVHGNKNSAKNLTVEFPAYVLTKETDLNLAPLCVKRKLKEIASWHQQRACWYVRDEIRQKYDLEELSSAGNTWSYVTSAYYQFKTKPKSTNVAEKSQTTTVAVPSPVVTPTTPKRSSITKFVKVLTPEEREKQLRTADVEKRSGSPKNVTTLPKMTNSQLRTTETNVTEHPIKKRAILFSMKKDGNWTATQNFEKAQSVNEVNAVSSAGDIHVTSVNPVIKAIFDKKTESDDKIQKFVESETNYTVREEVENKLPFDKKTNEIQPVLTTTTEDSKKRKVSTDNVTVKQGKKYATLIPIKKVKE